MGNIDLQSQPTPIGYGWRSSNWFVISTIAIALFGETFLYGFLVPIVGYIFQDRLHIDPSHTQQLTSAVLAIHGAISVVAGPIIGHFADKTPKGKMPLLVSLASCIVGTALVAAARSVPVLFLGRVMQGVAGSAVWIIGFATVADTAGRDNLGTVMGLMMSFVNSGTISGPAISGLLIEATGYWVTWSVPLLVLTIDLMARAVMIETPPSKTASDTAENASLLSAREEAQNARTRNFYRVMLCDARALTCLLVAISSTTVSTSFHATLPLYVQETFQWGPGTTGLVFACFVVPTLVLGPVAGWVRDRVGSRPPAVVASVLQAVLFGLLGIAGCDRVPWASPRTGGPALYIACISAIGAMRPFVSGIGPVELTAIVTEYQKNTPGIFGPEGGASRVFAMMEVAASLGMMLGPIIGGFLKEMFGHSYMSWTWGGLYLVVAVLVMCFLGSDDLDENLDEETV